MVDSADWSKQGAQAWLKAQQDFVKAWQDGIQTAQKQAVAGSHGFGQSGFGQAPFDLFAMNGLYRNPFISDPDPLMGAFDQWWKLARQNLPDMPETVRDVMERTRDLGKNYFEIARGMMESAAQGADAGEAAGRWVAAMEDGVKTWNEQLKAGLNAEAPGYLMFTDSGTKGWEQALDGAMRWFGLSARQFSSQLGAGAIEEQLIRALEAPALGYTREKQAEVQMLARTLLDFMNALRAYKLAFARTGLESLKALRERLAEPDAPVHSARELYDLWVDVNEDVYGKFAMSDEYQVVYGDMVNALISVQNCMHRLTEDIYKAVNLPTRPEFDSLAQRLQQTRRENRALKKQLRSISQRLDALQPGSALPAPEEPAPAQEPGVDETEDLTLIKGVGPKLQEKLWQLGIATIGQLAAMDRKAVGELESALNSAGRVSREKWVEQAKMIIKATTASGEK